MSGVFRKASGSSQEDRMVFRGFQECLGYFRGIYGVSGAFKGFGGCFWSSEVGTGVFRRVRQHSERFQRRSRRLQVVLEALHECFREF